MTIAHAHNCRGTDTLTHPEAVEGKNKKSKQKPQSLCSQFGAVICFWAAKIKSLRNEVYDVWNIVYMDNTPFPPLLKITPVLPIYTQSMFLSEATAQWSLIPSTLHPPLQSTQ